MFNYFHSDDLRTNLKVWDYTAGWFQEETKLNNSTVLVPDPKQESPYTIINHCRWDNIFDVAPSLILKKDFDNFVLANFEANNIVPMPILYRLA